MSHVSPGRAVVDVCVSVHIPTHVNACVYILTLMHRLAHLYLSPVAETAGQLT